VVNRHRSYKLTSLGYEISDKNELVDEAKGEKVKDTIYDFLDDPRDSSIPFNSAFYLKIA